eukprot:3620190-Amphidinium_carterae.1
MSASQSNTAGRQRGKQLYPKLAEDAVGFQVPSQILQCLQQQRTPRPQARGGAGGGAGAGGGEQGKGCLLRLT